DQSSAMEGFLNTSSQRLLASFPDINDAIEKLIYIASDKEMKILRSATTKEEKIKEFLKFWQRHDPTPGTFENELMEEYYRRIEFANKHFFGNKEGWRTDMGMVYVKMGPPDYIDRPELMTRRNIYNVNDSYLRTYRVEWDYYEQGRRFIFYFKAGEFRLMNRDEVFDVLN
ncbi:MAG: GWxTD domain-containing protein, partial [Calditrichaeota bacterium]